MEEPTRKKSRNEAPVGSEGDGTAPNREDPSDSDIYLILTYDILRIVFQYLNGKDLASVAMVCKSWSEAANNEKRTRGPACFIQHYKKPSEALTHVENIRIKPSIGLFFIPGNTPRNIEGRILGLLPNNCNTVMLYSSGIIINDKEMECHAFPNIICALLPQIPNVKVETFNIIEPSLHDKSMPYQCPELIKMLDETITSSDEISTCLMIFCNYQGYNMAKLLAKSVQKRENKIVSLWGGIVDDMYMQNVDVTVRANVHINSVYKGQNLQLIQEVHEPCCVAVLITGSIQTWSTIIDKKCKTKEQVEARLRLFKEQVKLKKHSMGFMFSCKARGRNMYNDEKNVESTIFKRVFPKVSLAGCFGNGEFGKNTISVDEINKKTSRKKTHKEHKIKSRRTSWYNEFSTMFMILTYG